VFALNTTTLWQKIIAKVEQHFQYKLPPTRETLKGLICTYSTLRSICKKVGIQVQAKDYNFSSNIPFQAGDILALYPIVKHANPEVIVNSIFNTTIVLNKYKDDRWIQLVGSRKIFSCTGKARFCIRIAQ
jgi:hypothetical protein